MQLTRTPFTDFEAKKNYQFTEFTELGISLRFLNEVPEPSKIPSGNFYRFGVLEQGKYFWFFHGEATANSRAEMREVFEALNLAFINSESKPFAYKVKRA